MGQSREQETTKTQKRHSSPANRTPGHLTEAGGLEGPRGGSQVELERIF